MTAVPALEAYASRSAWLHAWVTYHLRLQRERSPRPAEGLDDIPAMYLHGSIGYDSALSPSGDVWLHEYDLDIDADLSGTTWRLASPTERLAALVVALKRFPELQSVLPERNAASELCQGCEGTGNEFYGVSSPGPRCAACGGLGWIDRPA